MITPVATGAFYLWIILHGAPPDNNSEIWLSFKYNDPAPNELMCEMGKAQAEAQAAENFVGLGFEDIASFCLPKGESPDIKGLFKSIDKPENIL